LQVLDDLGVEAIAAAASAPRNKARAPQQDTSQQAEDEEADALTARLLNLKS